MVLTSYAIIEDESQYIEPSYKNHGFQVYYPLTK